MIEIGGVVHWGVKWQDDIEEAESDLRCMVNNLAFDLEETLSDEGFYPERAIIIEEKYQQSGRTNGLFTGLMSKDVEIPNNNPE